MRKGNNEFPFLFTNTYYTQIVLQDSLQILCKYSQIYPTRRIGSVQPMRTNAHQSLHRYKIAYSSLDNGSTRRISQQCTGLQRRWRALLAMLVGCTLLIFCYWTFQSMGGGSPFLIEQQANEGKEATTFIQEDPLPAKEKSTAASRNDAQTKKTSQIHSATGSNARNFAQNSSAFKIAPANRTSNFSMPRPEMMAGMNECAEKPPNLIGPIPVWLDGPETEKLEELNPDVGAGGHWWPQKCRARHRVAIIVPYRDREKHLHIFLHNLHSFLQKQQLDYGIFIVEQMANQTFNRGKLMNVGFVEASRLYGWQCFIFHDVDLLPEDDRNIYSCPQQPRHMSVAVDKFKYKLPYKSLFGGAEAVNRKQFEKMNGFSNDYWGWGGEDDDISARIVYAGLQISRYPTTIARYKMIKHTKEQLNPVNDCRYGLLAKTKSRWRRDGLTNLDYRLIAVHFDRLYTNITVDLLETESRRALSNEHIKEGC